MIVILEKISIRGIEYFKDDRLKEFRNTKNPHDRLCFEEVCRCINCMNYWHEDNLKFKHDKGGIFKGCPVCETDSYLGDIT